LNEDEHIEQFINSLDSYFKCVWLCS